MRRTIDAIDYKIIELMQDNARISIKDIAAEVFLSSPAVTARIERLEDAGVLEGYHASVNLDAMGYKIKAFINLDLDPVRKEEFYSFARKNENVIECSCVTGDFSILLHVIFTNTEDLDEFVNTLQGFGKTSTQIVFSTAIDRRGIPIEAC